MVDNFWLNKRRDALFAKHRNDIAKHHKITLLELTSLNKTKRYELLEITLKMLAIKAKKQNKEKKIGT
jgi:hypothetical protein